MQLLLLIEIAAERVELLGPELLVARDPGRGRLQRRGGKLAADDAPFLGALDQPGLFQHAQVLHEAGQRHVVRRGELAHGGLAGAAKAIEDVAARAVGERGEERVELIVGILNHKV